ncbi:MAG: L,D-transpeptidase family protein [Alphaproteobacteria bacterium]
MLLQQINVYLNNLIDFQANLEANGHIYPCVIGKNGATHHKKEGDGKTPLGRWPMRHLFYRADRLALPLSYLPTSAIAPDDGWCDDPNHPLYNQAVKLPFTASHEKMWREDNLYDLVVVLGYNDAPIIPHRGSAIFWHLPQQEGTGTAGCVALALAAFLDILPQCSADSVMNIIMV